METNNRTVALLRKELAAYKRRVANVLDRLESLYWACENGDGNWLESACDNAGKTLRKYGRIEDEEDE